MYKCFNCIKRNPKNINNKADDPCYSSRKDYLTIREKLVRLSRTHSHHFHETFQCQTTNFSQNYMGDMLPNPTYARQNADRNYLYSIDDLRKCRTKMEQLNVIMSLVKYAV